MISYPIFDSSLSPTSHEIRIAEVDTLAKITEELLSCVAKQRDPQGKDYDQAFSQLGVVSHLVLVARNGIGVFSPKTFEETAEILGLEKEEVKTIEENATALFRLAHAQLVEVAA